MLNRYRDVFRSLQEHNVKYVLIGGIAAVIHGIPRATFDLEDVRLIEMQDKDSAPPRK